MKIIHVIKLRFYKIYVFVINFGIHSFESKPFRPKIIMDLLEGLKKDREELFGLIQKEHIKIFEHDKNKK